nr:28S ribosomal protein S5, mitochondrial [Onthophagus taurus]
MATCMLNITKSLQKLTLNSAFKLKPTFLNEVNPSRIPTNEILFGTPIRGTNFFNKLPAEALWKGVTSVSNAGKKRGRGKTVSKKNMKNLNKGQIIGVGKANIIWPGLSAPIIRGKELVQQQQLPEDPDREKKLIALRDNMGSLKLPKLSPIERGWVGNKMGGRSLGPPDPIGDDKFDGFDTRVLEFKTVFNMTGNLGRKRRLSVFAVTGNGNGLAGFATGKGVEPRTAFRKAKNRSGQKLMNIKVFENRTVYHDFYCQFGKTKVFVSQRPEGHGVIAQRAIKTICQVVGIKDLHARVEGSHNVQHIVKAFFLGLLQQKEHTELAEEKQLHLVEFSKERSNFPKVLASPTKARTSQEVKGDEVMDFSMYCLGNRVILKKKKFPPFYVNFPSYKTYQKKQEKLRGQDRVRLNMLAEYGEIRSFLSEKYPECRSWKQPPKEKSEESEN